MLGGEQATEPCQVAQAAWNVTAVTRLRAEQPDAHVVVLGDLNVFYDSPSLDAFRTVFGIN